MNWHVPPDWPKKYDGETYLLLVNHKDRDPTFEIGYWSKPWMKNEPRFSCTSALSKPFASVLIPISQIRAWIPMSEIPLPVDEQSIP